MKSFTRATIFLALQVTTAIAAVQFATQPRAARAAAAPDAPRAADAPDPENWRQRFDALYHLDPGEDARFVPAPFAPERVAYYRNGPMRTSNPVLATTGQFTFHWTGGNDPPLKQYSFSSGPGTVGSALAACGLFSWEMELGPGLDWSKFPPVDGDWIIRNDAPLEKKLSAVQTILQRQTKRPIQLQKRLVQREAIVATGKFAFQPLPGANKDDGIYVMASERVSQNGGGSGTLAQFFESLSDTTLHKVVDETASSAQKVNWSWDLSASRAAESAKELDALLANVSRQTGLTVRTEKRPVEIWFLFEGQARAQ